MVDCVIDYCETHNRFDYLLREVRQVNPEQYLVFEPELLMQEEIANSSSLVGKTAERSNALTAYEKTNWLTVAASVATILGLLVAILAFGRDLLDVVLAPTPSTETPAVSSAVTAGASPALCPPKAAPPLPARPPFYRDYATILADFLTVGGTAARLESALREWDAMPGGSSVQSLDLTGDGVEEVVVPIVQPYDLTEVLSGDVLIFMCDAGAYEVAYQASLVDVKDPDGKTFVIMKIEDVNDTGLLDLVYYTSTGYAEEGDKQIYVIEWNGTKFSNRAFGLPQTANSVFTVSDGQIMIDIGGGLTVGDGIGRDEKEIWLWHGDVYTFERTILGPPITLVHYLHDGDDALRKGSFEDAVRSYESAITDFNKISGLDLGPEPEEAETEEQKAIEVVHAYARLKLMVVSAALGNQADASFHHDTLLLENPNGTSGYPFVPLGKAFWKSYVASSDPRAGCAALVAVAETDPGPASLLFAGWNNREYEPIDLCTLPQ